MPFGWAKRTWCAWEGDLPQMRQGCRATARRCCFERLRLSSPNVSALLSILLPTGALVSRLVGLACLAVAEARARAQVFRCATSGSPNSDDPSPFRLRVRAMARTTGRFRSQTAKRYSIVEASDMAPESAVANWGASWNLPMMPPAPDRSTHGSLSATVASPLAGRWRTPICSGS